MAPIARLKYATLDRYDADAREWTAHYLIDDVDPTEGGATIVTTAANMPQLGDVFTAGSDFDTYAVAVSYSGISPVNWQQSRNLWQCQVKYSTDQNKQRRPAQNTENPINKPPVISFTGHRRRAAAHDVRAQDQGGRFVLNPCNDFFPDREVQVDDSSLILRITRNYATVDLELLEEYTDSVNSVTWFGKPPRSWKMDPPQGRKVYWGNTAYYEIAYSFQANAETWDLQPRILGKRDKDGKLNAPGGVTVPDYAPLSADGTAFLTTTEPPLKYDGVGGNPQPFKWYREKDFTLLGLPADL